MGVTIGHASLNEIGRATGGKPGDQNGREVGMRQWYDKGFTVVLRPKDRSLAEKSAKACESGCRNDHIGYAQERRNTLHDEAKKVGYDLTKITNDCDTDCSAFMTVCAIAGGASELEYKGNAPTTSTMVNAFVNSRRYDKITTDMFIKSDAYLKRGDILVKPGSHTAMVLTNGVATGIKTPRAVDLSKYNNVTSYTNLRAAGIKYAILKVIEKAGNVEPYFEKHYNGCLNAGIEVMAVYNYSYATTVEDAKREAKAVLKALGNRKIPVAIDVEDKRQQGLGVLLIDIIKNYQRIIEGAGLPFIIYTGMNFHKNYVQPFQGLIGEQQYWIARYPFTTRMSVSDEPPVSKKPNIPGMFMWQYTSTLQISEACPGNLDCNLVYAPIMKINKSAKKGVVKDGITALRVRTMPSTDSDIIDKLYSGDEVSIYAESNGWYKISADKQQWVSGEYVTVK